MVMRLYGCSKYFLFYFRAIERPCNLDENSSKFCEWLRRTVAENYLFVKAQIEERLKGHIDSYWYQIHLYYQQIEGIEFGWRYGLRRSPMKRSGLEIPLVDFLILNLGADLRLLQSHYNAMVKDADLPDIQFVNRQTQTIRLNMQQDAHQRLNMSLDHLLLHE